MGFVDALVAEDRVELKVSDLWKLMYNAAEVGAEYKSVLKMIHLKNENGISVFTKDQIEQFTKERM